MTEQTPNEAEYERRYRRVGDHLMLAADKLSKGLIPIDVTGIMFATAIEFLRQHEPEEDVVEWLRDLADALENGEVGFRPTKH